MCVTSDPKVCSLVLEDGTVLTGYTFGAEKQIDGEVGKHSCYNDWTSHCLFHLTVVKKKE